MPKEKDPIAVIREILICDLWHSWKVQCVQLHTLYQMRYSTPSQLTSYLIKNNLRVILIIRGQFQIRHHENAILNKTDQDHFFDNFFPFPTVERERDKKQYIKYLVVVIIENQPIYKYTHNYKKFIYLIDIYKIQIIKISFIIVSTHTHMLLNCNKKSNQGLNSAYRTWMSTQMQKQKKFDSFNFFQKSYHRIQNAIDSLEIDMCQQPKHINGPPPQCMLLRFPQPPQMTIEINLQLTFQDLQCIKPIYKQVEEQEELYQRKEDLFDIFSYLKDVDGQIFNGIIEILRKEKVSDSLAFLSKGEQIGDVKKKYFKGIANALKNIHEHDFNINDYSTEIKQEVRENLIKKIKDDQNIIEYLKFIVNLTAFDSKFIQCGSNSLNLLVEMKADLKNHNFENIRIKNTNLIGSNFVRCNLNGSEFDNVDISGMNVNGAQLFNCKWKNIKIHELNKLDGHSNTVNSVCFSPDGNTLASGSSDNSIRLWDVKTGQQKSKLDHTSRVMSVCFSSDGKTLSSGSYDNSIRVWDVKTGQQKSKLDGHSDTVRSVCFSPDGTTLASGSDDESIRLWDVKTEQLKAKLDGHTSYVMSVCFSPYGTTLASGSNDNYICLWDVKTGELKAQLDGHSNCINSVCFSPDGNSLASGSDDESIRLWDVKTGQQKSKLEGHSMTVRSVCFSPDGNILASGGYDNSIRLWDIKTGQQKSKLVGHTNSVWSVCFSPDGTTLASVSEDKSICLWDIKTGQQKSKLDGHSNCINSVCFSPDSNSLASGSDDKSVRLWDVKTGQQKAQLDAHSNTVLSVCFSPAGTILASGSWDCSIRLWDVNKGYRSDFRSTSFSHDATTLASGNYEKSINLWDFMSGKLIQQSEKSSLDIVQQFKKPLQNHKFSQVIPILLIAQRLHFEAYSALIFQGEFINHLGQDLRYLFKERGGLFLESPMQQFEKQS